MNWAAFFMTASVLCGTACVPLGIEYISWEYPQYHKTNRNCLIAGFVITVVTGALAAGFGVHR